MTNRTRIVFTNFEVSLIGFEDKLFKTCKIELKLLPYGDSISKGPPQPNASDLPEDMRVALLEWLSEPL